MAFRITKQHVWFGVIPDRADALAEKLRALHEGGLDLEMILGRRDWSGVGMMFISPLRNEQEIEAARQAGLSESDSMPALRIEGPNVPGIAAKIATALAEAGISLRDYSALALGEQHVTTIGFDSDAEVERAREVLERALGS